MMQDIVLILVLIAGLITLIGSIMGWEGMFRSRRSQRIVESFGMTGARVIYGLVGLAIIVGAILGLLGVFD